MMSSFSVPVEVKKRRISSSAVILVPYQRHHVPKYNQWMQNPELQYLTGSEPLTLEQEFEMLDSWNSNPQRCTFIVLDRARYDSLSSLDEEERQIQSMIGDVNFYLSDEGVAEIEIMIAETWARNRGCGKQATILMMKLAHNDLNIQIFQAKIKMSNLKSQKLFQEVFGFKEVSRSDVFEEITYEADLSKPDCHLKKLLLN